jgi:hypothetical protein
MAMIPWQMKWNEIPDLFHKLRTCQANGYIRYTSVMWMIIFSLKKQQWLFLQGKDNQAMFSLAHVKSFELLRMVLSQKIGFFITDKCFEQTLL